MSQMPVQDQQLAVLFASMVAGVYCTDADGRLLTINAEALRLLGREGEDLTGQLIHDLAHDRTPEGDVTPADACQLLGPVRSGQPVRSDDDTFWRAEGTPMQVSWLSAPMVTDDELTGTTVVFVDATTKTVETQRRRESEQERAAEVQRLTETNERLSFLGLVSEAVAILDLDEGLRRLGRLTVGRHTDACVLHSVEDGIVRRVAIAQRDVPPHPEPEDSRRLQLTADSTGALAQALTSGAQQQAQAGGEPSRASPRADPMAAALADAAADAGAVSAEERPTDPMGDEMAALFAELGGAHALVTPLVARHQVLGAMTWVRLDPAEPFTEDDESLAADVARRAGLVLDNARMYGQQRRAAETIQRSLLTVLPDLGDLQITARYLPATEGAEVGGDWYDAFVLPDGATSVVIGDILGHDLPAASSMSQVRNVLRALAYDRQDPPSEIMQRLDQAMDGLHVNALATCLLGRIEQTQEQHQAGVRMLRWTSAGHLPPALVDAEGTVTLLERPADLMLGVVPDIDRSDHTQLVEAGCTIWLYTDGLVERSDQPLDQGLARLRRALAGVATLPLDEACDQLLARMLPGSQPDDVAVLAVRAVADSGSASRPEAGPG